LFAYSRVLDTQEVFVVFNSAARSQTLPNRTVTYPAGTVLVNLLHPEETCRVAAGSQTPAITVPAMTAKIFITQAQLRPLDPVVISNSPNHDAAKVSPASPVVLRFSQPMDTNSVQAAFATAPALTGKFSWSASGETLTFTPAGAGLAPMTNITVTIGRTASAVSGQPLIAAYQLSFHTAAAPP